ncbi:protein phosphatase 1 regulatory subunit 1B-like [Osmerus eperlanus]|uniref:protein phosphatase 1 regulatory subunit 1B-like n=1 Tax=Osmerus eperlanus TaxID=29151 RepID=UPI002E12468A
MDPLLPAEMDREAAKDSRRIQFSVPSAVPTQLDPRQVEMIRRRRPTPATLFRLTDHASPEDDNPTHQWEHGVLKTKRVNATVYQPPSLKAVQRMAQAHMETLGSVDREDPSSEDEDSEENQESFPSTDTESQTDTKSMENQSRRLLGSEVNSERRSLPVNPRRAHHGDEEEEEDDDGGEGKGE